MKTKFLGFLQNLNVVRISGECEYTSFQWLVDSHKLADLLPACGLRTYAGMLALFPRERYPGWDGKTLYAECQIGKEGIGIYPYSPDVAAWYGAEPYSIDDIW